MEGKVVLVTGGAFGIGRSICLKAASQRAAGIIVVDLEQERTAGEKTAQDCVYLGVAKAVFGGCDVSDGGAVKRVVQDAVKQFGRLDAVFANAGVNGASTAGGWAHEVADTNFERVIAVNLTGVFHTAKYSLPYLVESKGALVNTASSFGMVGAHFSAAYAASKGGVINMTRSLAKDYGPLGVRVNGAHIFVRSSSTPRVDITLLRSLTLVRSSDRLRFRCPCFPPLPGTSPQPYARDTSTTRWGGPFRTLPPERCRRHIWRAPRN